jgi:gliding motility-associated-like protein
MINNSVGAVSYEWDFDDGNTSTLENPTHEYSDAIANYVIVLTAISEHGCTDTAEAVVIVEEELIYYVPNTFTPDGDGLNEEFKPQFTSGFDRDTYHLYIFDRWGQLVFESKDVDYGWNGSFAGEVAQDGTYTWKIEFKSLDRDEVQLEALTGHVNILK